MALGMTAQDMTYEVVNSCIYTEPILHAYFDQSIEVLSMV